MIERRHSTGFALETLPRFGRASEMLRQDFDRNRTVEPRAPRAVTLLPIPTHTNRAMISQGPSLVPFREHQGLFSNAGQFVIRVSGCAA
jgi:hypothetical protein